MKPSVIRVEQHTLIKDCTRVSAYGCGIEAFINNCLWSNLQVIAVVYVAGGNGRRLSAKYPSSGMVYRCLIDHQARTGLGCFFGTVTTLQCMTQEIQAYSTMALLAIKGRLKTACCVVPIATILVLESRTPPCSGGGEVA